MLLSPFQISARLVVPPGGFGLPPYDKKLARKGAKVSLAKCGDGYLTNKNRIDNSNTTVTSSTVNNNHNANMNVNYIESDSEYETEEVYELREWYPPDYWKSNNFNINNANISLSNLNHLRKKEEEKKNKKQVCLTDVTVDDLTITMMESQTGQGFFKKV